MSAGTICSTTFICDVLIVTVTWSGVGVRSASMWRVSSESHLAFSPSVSGAKEIDPPTVGHRLAQASQQLVEPRQALRSLAVLFASVHMQHRGAGIVAIDRCLHLILH